MSAGGLVGALDVVLPFWFVAWDLVRLGLLQGFGSLSIAFGLDFEIYRAAGRAVIDGSDPWLASAGVPGASPVHFAALPVAAQAFVPFALMPLPVGLALWSVASLLVAWLALRRLGLPAWWLLFPPIVDGLVSGNPQILLFGLLVLGAVPGSSPGVPRRRPRRLARALSPLWGALAAVLKIYAVVPLAARRDWRALLLTAAAIAASVGASPALWASYLARFEEVAARLVVEAGGGTSATAVLALSPPAPPLLMAAVLVAAVLLVVGVAWRDVGAAGWLAVPLAWPAAEYHYATLALPVVRRSAALVMAMAVPGSALLGMVILALRLLVRPRVVDEAGRPPVGLVSWLRSWPSALRPPPSAGLPGVPLTTRATGRILGRNE